LTLYRCLAQAPVNSYIWSLLLLFGFPQVTTF